jgi:hypothetical protein
MTPAARDARQQRALGDVLGQSSGADLAACHMDQLEHDGQPPMQRHVGLERAAAAPDAMIANRPYSVPKTTDQAVPSCAAAQAASSTPLAHEPPW